MTLNRKSVAWVKKNAVLSFKKNAGFGIGTGKPRVAGYGTHPIHEGAPLHLLPGSNTNKLRNVPNNDRININKNFFLNLI